MNKKNKNQKNYKNSKISDVETSEDSNEENIEFSNGKSSDESSENENSEDDTPTETAIEKNEPTLPSKVTSGQIAANFPTEQIVHVNRLPKKCKVIDIVEAFAKYGPIDTIHIQEGPTNSTANVAFKNSKAARAALSAHKISVIKGETILVKMKTTALKKQKNKIDKSNVHDSRDRSVYVKFLKRHTTEGELREHFSPCGDIECVRIILKNSITFAFVTFTDKTSVTDALALHNSVLNGTTIGVFKNTADAASHLGNRDPKLTIMLKNKQNLESVEGQKLNSIFNKCGEIESMDVVCRKNALAFITFKTEEAVEKAFKLNGKSLQNIAVEVVAYNPHKPKTSIFVTNVAKDVNEVDLREHFTKSGDISAIIVKKGFAIIHFKESSGYCNSFLLNETILKGQMIFLEPHSIKKQAILKSKQNHGKKRTAQILNNVIGSKRVRNA